MLIIIKKYYRNVSTFYLQYAIIKDNHYFCTDFEFRYNKIISYLKQLKGSSQKVYLLCLRSLHFLWNQTWKSSFSHSDNLSEFARGASCFFDSFSFNLKSTTTTKTAQNGSQRCRRSQAGTTLFKSFCFYISHFTLFLKHCLNIYLLLPEIQNWSHMSSPHNTPCFSKSQFSFLVNI